MFIDINGYVHRQDFIVKHNLYFKSTRLPKVPLKGLFRYLNENLFFTIKRSVNVISLIEWHVRFTTVPFKLLSDQGLQLGILIFKAGNLVPVKRKCILQFEVFSVQCNLESAQTRFYDKIIRISTLSLFVQRYKGYRCESEIET